MKVAKFLVDLGYTNVAESKMKISFYRKVLQCSFLEIIDMIKIQPKVLDLSEERILAQTKMLKTKLNLQEIQLSNLILKNPNFLGMSEKYITQKLDFIKNLFNIQEIEEFVCKVPEILLYKDSVLEQRLQMFEDNFLLHRAQAQQLIKNTPSILKKEIFGKIEKTYDDYLEYISQIAPKEVIIKNPNLLTFPSRKLKIRYLILAPVFDGEKIFEGNNLMRNERLLWARREYLREKQLDAKMILYNKRAFEEVSGFSDNEIIKKYPLTIESVDILEKEYLEKFGKMLTLDKKERNEVFSFQSEQKFKYNRKDAELE